MRRDNLLTPIGFAQMQRSDPIALRSPQPRRGQRSAYRPERPASPRSRLGTGRVEVRHLPVADLGSLPHGRRGPVEARLCDPPAIWPPSLARMETAGRTYKEHLSWRDARPEWSPDADCCNPVTGLLALVCAGCVPKLQPCCCLPCGRPCQDVRAANQLMEAMHSVAM